MPRRPRKRQYGLGSIQKRGGKFRVQWREGQRRKSKPFDTLDMAEKFLTVRRAIAETTRAGVPRDLATVPTLDELVPAWLDSRERTHRSTKWDRSRWTNHIKPKLGRLRPDELDAGELRKFALDRLGAGLNSSSVRLLMRLLSTLYGDLIDDGNATRNPVRDLPRKVRALFKPAHDPKTTPFVERQQDIGRIYLALPEPINVAYAIGALAGLRTGEVLALAPSHINLATRRIHVRVSTGGPLKDKDSRIVPILDALAPILEDWLARLRGPLVIPPLRKGSKHLDPHTVSKELADALALPTIALPALTWYQATRHTFASHWVMAGGSLEQLREILGHASVTTTERYAHLKPEMFGPAAHARLGNLGTNLAPRALRGLAGKMKNSPVI